MHDIVIQSSEWSSVNAVSNLQTFEFKRNHFLMSRQIMYGHCLTRTSWCRSYIFIMIVCILLATTKYYIYKDIYCMWCGGTYPEIDGTFLINIHHI